MFRLPNNKQRLALVGRTGSGKTQAGVWHLSMRNIDTFPWVIFNWKEDELINSIERAHHIDIGYVPKRGGGLYIVSPTPSQTEEVDAYLWKLWEREAIGIFVDEGYMIPSSSEAFDTVLTQGRSKRVPAIVCSQRPVWMTRFVWSESDFIQAFDLTVDDDKNTIRKYAPIDLRQNIPDFYSWYYDVGKKELNLLKPVPDADSILEKIDSKLITNRRYI